GIQRTIGSKDQSVRLVAIFGEDRRLFRFGIEADDQSLVLTQGNVRKINAPVRRDRTTFGQTTFDRRCASIEQLQLRSGRNDRVSRRRRNFRAWCEPHAERNSKHHQAKQNASSQSLHSRYLKEAANVIRQFSKRFSTVGSLTSVTSPAKFL